MLDPRQCIWQLSIRKNPKLHTIHLSICDPTNSGPTFQNKQTPLPSPAPITGTSPQTSIKPPRQPLSPNNLQLLTFGPTLID